ncbi:MAG: FIST N-terminal domain-containing protein [Alphaproteobacteria bacterium]
MTDTAAPNGVFRSGIAAASDWQAAIADVLVQLGEPTASHRLGIFYVSHHFASSLQQIEEFLRQTTAVPSWVGMSGHGVLATQKEHFDEPAIAAMLLPLDETGFKVFSGVTDDADPAVNGASEWLEQAVMPLVLIHADPGNELLPPLIEDMALETGGFLFGGLGAASGAGSSIVSHAEPKENEMSGVMISPQAVEIATGLSQGCTPIGPSRTITSAEDNVIFQIDDRPALDVLKEDIGELLSRDLQKIGGYIFAALPIEGSDTQDYLVRNMVGVDPQHGVIAIGAAVETGARIMFCRRDPKAAMEDMNRMLLDIKKRVDGKPIKGGIYISCAARGPNQFPRDCTETHLIEQTLGSFPLIGFFASGEISRDRLYAYTGVLALFL